MYPHLNKLGIEQPQRIESFIFRREGVFDVLKVYLKKSGSELFSKSHKFKFQRSEEDGQLRLAVIQELETICRRKHEVKSRKEKLMADISHLEKVVHSKLAEIRHEIEQLED
ncbi:DUF3461 family protein [Pelagibaculum spongiae]|uniref:DUF3461 domain-containing protein n=1 Tax=Pelagibaculum spongiae TaxID=2080658 RepID=A0A2V1GZ42_9GAMM|nr:DUF3461 family protein [Pelagibaculum spongiae]PVZ66409.1 hypothetical protein DC094_17090 [Pelagibaculum spongiae]